MNRSTLSQLDLHGGIRVFDKRPPQAVASALASVYGPEQAEIKTALLAIESETGRRSWHRRWLLLDAAGKASAFVYLAGGVPVWAYLTDEDHAALRVEAEHPSVHAGLTPVVS